MLKGFIYWPSSCGDFFKVCLSHFYFNVIPCAQLLSRVRLFVILWTVTHQAPLSMGFSRQEYWSGLHFLLQGNLPNSGIKSASPASPALAGGFFTTEPPGKPWRWLALFFLACLLKKKKKKKREIFNKENYFSILITRKILMTKTGKYKLSIGFSQFACGWSGKICAFEDKITCYVILGKWLHLSESQFYHLQSEGADALSPFWC